MDRREAFAQMIAQSEDSGIYGATYDFNASPKESKKVKKAPIINKFDQHLVGSVQVFIGNVTNSNPEQFTKFDGADVMYSICGDLA